MLTARSRVLMVAWGAAGLTALYACSSDSLSTEGNGTADAASAEASSTSDASSSDGATNVDALSDAARREPTVHVFARAFTTCATKGGAAKCWGANDKGQLGNGAFAAAVRTPVDVSALTAPTQLEPANAHTCALSAAGVSCWGSNVAGQLGHDPASDPKDCAGVACRNVPQAVAGLVGATDLAAGIDFTCAVAGGAVSCWGSPNYAELGPARDGGATFSPGPVPMTGTVVEVRAGSNSVCARKADGTVWCWGRNQLGQLGSGASDAGFDGTAHATPVQVPGLTGVVSVAVGGQHACAIRGDGTVACWGANSNGETTNPGGQLGHDPSSDPACTGGAPCSASPTTVSGITNARKLALGSYHSCALLADDTVSCWGNNNNGLLGHDPSKDLGVQFAPKPVTGLTNVGDLALGDFHSCAVTRDNQVLCWGENGAGQLAKPVASVGSSFTPVAVGL